MIDTSNLGLIDQRFEIKTLIKQGRYAHTFRVKDTQTDKLCFMKLIELSLVENSQLANDGSSSLELDILTHHNAPGISDIIACNHIKLSDGDYAYLVQKLVIGETAVDYISRKGPLGQEQSIEIISDLLQTVESLHNQEYPVLHNDITPMNVMLDMGVRGKLTPKLIDFGAARYLTQPGVTFSAVDQDINYTASEAVTGKYSISTDIFALGSLYFFLLCGHAPWKLQINDFQKSSHDIYDQIKKLRTGALSFSSSPYRLAENTKAIIEKALNPVPTLRFKTVESFRKSLYQELIIIDNVNSEKEHEISFKAPAKEEASTVPFGFEAIAGMQELKEILQRDVINALKEREKYQKYLLDIPNGMLLYGPPGCGKTYFVERFAEELGNTYVAVKPSELKSKWVGEGVKNIAKMFDEARSNAPCTLFIDELDALVSERSNDRMSESESNMVNEFLVQMNECAKAGVFVIGATNLPEKIDPAITRRGRLDKHFYLPPPDYDARVAMLKLHLKGRPLGNDINFDSLAESSQNFVASDLKYAVDEGARIALQQDKPILHEHLEEVINNMEPSITPSQLINYQKFKQAAINTSNSHTSKRIGF